MEPGGEGTRGPAARGGPSEGGGACGLGSPRSVARCWSWRRADSSSMPERFHSLARKRPTYGAVPFVGEEAAHGARDVGGALRGEAGGGGGFLDRVAGEEFIEKAAWVGREAVRGSGGVRVVCHYPRGCHITPRRMVHGDAEAILLAVRGDGRDREAAEVVRQRL